MYLKIYRLWKISRNGKTFREHEKNLVNINNNVGYDLKMKKYNPYIVIQLHSSLIFVFASLLHLKSLLLCKITPNFWGLFSWNWLFVPKLVQPLIKSTRHAHLILVRIHTCPTFFWKLISTNICSARAIDYTRYIIFPIVKMKVKVKSNVNFKVTALLSEKLESKLQHISQNMLEIYF